MKKTLSLAVASALLTSQAHAIFTSYGYPETINSYGTITATVSGECSFSKTYNIYDVGVSTYMPQNNLAYYANAEVSVKSDLGNFRIDFYPQPGKDTLKFDFSSQGYSVKAKSAERRVLYYLFAGDINSNQSSHKNYVESMDSEGDIEQANITFHNLYDKLALDSSFDGSCGSQLFKQKFLTVEPQLNSSAFKVNSTLDYSSFIEKGTTNIIVTTKLNTTFSGPLKHPHSNCTSTTPIAANATSYSVTCAAPKPVILTVSIAVNAQETFDGSNL